MSTLFTGSLSVVAGQKSYTPLPVSGGIQGLGKSLQVSIVMTGTAFPTGTTTLTIGLSTDGGATYREASGSYTAPFPPGKGGGVPNQTLGFTVGDTTTVTHVRLSTDAPSTFTLPVTVTAVGV